MILIYLNYNDYNFCLQRFSRILQCCPVIHWLFKVEQERSSATRGAVFEILKVYWLKFSPLSLLKYGEPLGNSYDNRDKQAMWNRAG